MYLLEVWFSLDICSGVGLLDHMVALFLVFKGTSIFFSIVALPVYIPTNSDGGFPFLHILSSIYCFDDGHSDCGAQPRGFGDSEVFQTWPLQADNTQKIHETGKHLMVGILSYSIHPEFGIAKKNFFE